MFNKINRAIKTASRELSKLDASMVPPSVPGCKYFSSYTAFLKNHSAIQTRHFPYLVLSWLGL